MTRIPFFSAILAAIVVAGCAPAGGSSTTAPAAEARPARALTVMDRTEPPALTGVASGGTTGSSAASFFSAGLTFTNDQALQQPYLAESLPKLETDSWKIFPDGRMETI